MGWALMGLIWLIGLMGLIGLISLMRKLLRGWGWVLFALGVGRRQCFRIVKAAFGIAP